MVKVVWEEWLETWRHVSAGGYGVYHKHEQSFTSLAEAQGFARGIKTNPHVRDVRIEL